MGSVFAGPNRRKLSLHCYAFLITNETRLLIGQAGGCAARLSTPRVVYHLQRGAWQLKEFENEYSVVGIYDAHYGAILEAYIEWKANAANRSMAELKNWVAGQIAAYKVPDRRRVMEQLPKNFHRKTGSQDAPLQCHH